jgi:dTDP-glucose pyrophosphorylase
MTDWKAIAISPDMTVRQAVKVIDSGALQIALVVDNEDRLIGTVTDGDIRRGILNGYSLDADIVGLMNTQPLFVRPEDDRHTIMLLMKQRRIHQIPLLDQNGRVLGIESIDELLQPTRRENWVVLMAGGLGSRLRPLTDQCPKPMLMIGDRPILETILENFIDQGFYKFYISVNYMAERIKSYFGNGSRWGVEIRYLEENKRLGTAGALTLMPTCPNEPFFVMNGDILARVNFLAMLDFHNLHRSMATMGVRQFTHTIPYGVVRLDGHSLVDIVEKPQDKVFVSSGIYLLSPEVVQKIPEDVFFDMPTLFQELVNEGWQISGFPIHEYWIDIGRIEDLEQARVDIEDRDNG